MIKHLPQVKPIISSAVRVSTACTGSYCSRHHPRRSTGGGLRILRLPYLIPPVPDRGDRKGGVVITAHGHPANIGAQIIDPIRDGLAFGGIGEVVDVHFLGIARQMPLSTALRKLANQLFLFLVHRDHRLPQFHEGPHPATDPAELRIPVRMGAAFLGFDCPLQAVIQLVQQPGDGPKPDRVPACRQFLGQLSATFTGSAQRRHEIAAGHRFHQGIEGGQQLRIGDFGSFTPYARPADPGVGHRLSGQFQQTPLISPVVVGYLFWRSYTIISSSYVS